jgi:hypothetical protein
MSYILIQIATDDLRAVPITLDAFGVPYDQIVLPAALNLEMVPNSVGAYGLIVVMAQWSSFADGQKLAITTYCTKYQVRLVKLNDIAPDASTGVTTSSTGINGLGRLYFNTAGAALATAAGIQPSAVFGCTGMFYFPGSLIAGQKAATPIMMYTSTTVAAAVINMPSYLQLSFYLPFGYWSINSVLLNHVWFNWGTRGLYQGYRRISFSTQVDDVFLKTETTSFPNGYRATTADMNEAYKWQTNINTRMSKGSRYKLDIVFNGNGVLATANTINSSIQYVNLADSSYEDVDKDFKKPLGTGVSNVCVFEFQFLCLSL